MKIKAYVWDDEYNDKSHIVWATTPGKAKALLAAEHDEKFTELRVKRLPWADQYKDFNKIPAAEFFKHGVTFKAKYPIISTEKFLKWAAKDITDSLPPNE